MSAQKDNPFLTITLTDRAAVKIKKDDWPIVASSSDENWDGQVQCQANRTSDWDIKVRQHNDGRTIIYVVYSYSSAWQHERGYDVRGGELITAVGDKTAIIEAIKRVGEWAQAQEHAGDDAARWTALMRECIADLPADVLV